MTSQTEDFDDIDEAQEEALLKSDDDCDTPPTVQKTDMNEDNDNTLDDVGTDTHKDDTDSDEDYADSDTILNEYNSVLQDIEKHPYSYEKYIKLCELSHSTDDIELIRKAYNIFASAYPLAPELWSKLIAIEKSLAHSSNELANVEALFRRALTDYFSVEIAIEFSTIVEKLPNAEKIWEELLGVYALDCMRGQELHKAYRKYIFSRSELKDEAREELYIKSYLNELQYPLKNMEESYIEFKVFFEKNKPKVGSLINWDEVDQRYFKAKEHFRKIIHFENELQSIDKKSYRERAEVYFEYIEAAEKFLDECVLRIVYERMVTDCCLNPECWLNYIDFVVNREKYDNESRLQNLTVFNQNSVDIVKRALRNCTWSEDLYIKHMYLLEMKDSCREDVQEVLESAMTAGFQAPEPVVSIWLEYLTYLRRHTNWEDEAECDILRKNFNLAWAILGQQWGVLADCNCEILQFWGKLEYTELNNPIRGKELWTTVMESSDNATKSGLWVEFIQMETIRDKDATRRLYQKSLNSIGLDNPYLIASAWERFERCYGTIKSLKICKDVCKKLQYAIQQSTENAKGSLKKQPNKGVKRKHENEAEVEVKKTKREDIEPTRVSKVPQNVHRIEFKSHETEEIDFTKDKLRVFLSNLDFDLTEDDLRENLSDLDITHVDLIRSPNGRSRGFGYLELSNEAEVEKALSMDRRSINGRPMFISSVLRDKEKRQKFKYSGEPEPKKLFIKSLPNDTTKEELEQIYGKHGELEDVRLVYHKSGKFKNIAYVEFKEESAAGKALLATNLMELRGHTISVLISAPPPKVSVPTSVDKLIGIAGRQSKLDKKPRMMLIPSVVRKKLTLQPTNGVGAQSKTNDEFRKLLK